MTTQELYEKLGKLVAEGHGNTVVLMVTVVDTYDILDVSLELEVSSVYTSPDHDGPTVLLEG